MLSNPQSGWCNVKIGDFIGSASYLDDVPFMCLDSFISYFTKYNGINNAAITFDEEGTRFTLISNSSCSFVIVERSDDPELIHYLDIEAEQLCTELIEDLEKDFDKWVNWDWNDEPEDGRSNKLRFKIEELKTLLAQS